MKLIYSLGIVVAITPFLGVPNTWKTVLLFGIGIVIFIKAYTIHRSGRYNKEKRDDNNSSFKQNDHLMEKDNILSMEFKNNNNE